MGSPAVVSKDFWTLEQGPGNGQSWLAMAVYTAATIAVVLFWLDGLEAWAIVPAIVSVGLLIYVGTIDYRLFLNLVIAPLICAGPIALGVEVLVEASDVAMAVSSVATILAGLGVWHVARGHLVRDPIPDVLETLLPEGRWLVERNGVQFGVALGDWVVPIGGRTTLEVFVQNAWGREVQVELRTIVRDDEGIRRVRSVEIPSFSFSLGRGEVGRVRVPVTVSPGAKGKMTVFPIVRVRGAFGRRLRPRFKPVAPEPAPSWFAFAMLATGEFEFGGGVAVELSVGGNVEDGTPAEAAPTYERVWSP